MKPTQQQNEKNRGKLPRGGRIVLAPSSHKSTCPCIVMNRDSGLFLNLCSVAKILNSTIESQTELYQHKIKKSKDTCKSLADEDAQSQDEKKTQEAPLPSDSPLQDNETIPKDFEDKEEEKKEERCVETTHQEELSQCSFKGAWHHDPKQHFSIDVGEIERRKYSKINALRQVLEDVEKLQDNAQKLQEQGRKFIEKGNKLLEESKDLQDRVKLLTSQAKYLESEISQLKLAEDTEKETGADPHQERIDSDKTASIQEESKESAFGSFANPDKARKRLRWAQIDTSLSNPSQASQSPDGGIDGSTKTQAQTKPDFPQK